MMISKVKVLLFIFASFSVISALAVSSLGGSLTKQGKVDTERQRNITDEMLVKVEKDLWPHDDGNGSYNSLIGMTFNSVDSVGDVNGDGLDDFIVGTVFVPEVFYLIFGKRDGWGKDLPIEEAADVVFYDRLTPSIYRGMLSVCSADLDKDGYSDLVISQFMRIYIFYGKETCKWRRRVDIRMADAVIIGDSQENRFFIRAMEDVNNDTYPDIFINDSNYHTDIPIVYLLYNSGERFRRINFIENLNKTIFYGSEMYFGKSVNIGDFDGDGIRDVLIGKQNGRLFLFFGRNNSWPVSLEYSDADIVFTSVSGGYALDVVDMNNDNVDDFLIGISSYGYGRFIGIVCLFLGKERDLWPIETSIIHNNDSSFMDELDGSRLGCSLQSVKDLNRDGFTDVLIGALGYDNFRGRAYLLYGKQSLYLENVNIASVGGIYDGETSEGMFGRDVSGGGDINGDGYKDIVIAECPHWNAYDAQLVPSKIHIFFHPVPYFDPAIGTRCVNAGERIEFAVYARNPDGGRIVEYGCEFAEEDYPEGISFDTTTGLFSWTPSDAYCGRHTIKFTAKDGNNRIGTEIAEIVVLD